MVIYGTGGHSLVILEIAISLNLEVDYFIDSNKDRIIFEGHSVKHNESISYPLDKSLIIAIGNNDIRKRISQQVEGDFSTLCSPQAYISQSAIINEGSVIAPLAAIQAKATIGAHAIINTGAIIEHGSEIGDFCHISTNATVCGDTSIGEGTFIDAGAVVGRGLTIGTNVKISAGSIVNSDLPNNSVI